jgi:hypothetical protein
MTNQSISHEINKIDCPRKKFYNSLFTRIKDRNRILESIFIQLQREVPLYYRDVSILKDEIEVTNYDTFFYADNQTFALSDTQHIGEMSALEVYVLCEITQRLLNSISGVINQSFSEVESMEMTAYIEHVADALSDNA